MKKHPVRAHSKRDGTKVTKHTKGTGKFAKYPVTDKFKPIDTIGVPHPFMIGPKHVAHAADHFGGMLGEAAIMDLESHIRDGVSCYICNDRKYQGERLTYKEHEQALLLEVKDKRELKDVPGLHKYLLKIKPLMEKDGYAGVAFKQGKV